MISHQGMLSSFDDGTGHDCTSYDCRCVTVQSLCSIVFRKSVDVIFVCIMYGTNDIYTFLSCHKVLTLRGCGCIGQFMSLLPQDSQHFVKS